MRIWYNIVFIYIYEYIYILWIKDAVKPTIIWRFLEYNGIYYHVMNMSDQEDAILVRLHMRYTMVYRIPSHMAMLIVKSCVRIGRQTQQYHRQIRASLTQQKEQPSSVQNPSIIPLWVVYSDSPIGLL